MTQVYLTLALLRMDNSERSDPKKICLQNIIRRIHLEMACILTFLWNLLNETNGCLWIIPHRRRTFGSYCMIYQFALKLNYAMDLLQETFLDSVPYAKMLMSLFT